MKKTLKTWFREWDEGRFDLTAAAAEETAQPVPDTTDEEAWRHSRLKQLESISDAAFQKFYPVMAVFLAAFMILFLLYVVSKMPAFGSADSPANTSEVIVRYIEQGIHETGAVNIVAGIILDYRAFDTLGESHVLFTAVICVLILLLTREEQEEPAVYARILQSDIILQKTAMVLIPLIMLFGIYIILNGHIGPGGGFSGGAVIGAAFILYSSAFGPKRLQRILNMKSYSLIVLLALMFYSLSKCYSFFCGANHLETVFTTGTPGAIFSAGLILPLNIAVGVVVACTMYGFYSVFTKGRI